MEETLSTIYWLETGEPATDATLAFAAQELATYANRIAGGRWKAQAAWRLQEAPGSAWLGICDWLPQPQGAGLSPSPWDDGYAIWTCNERLCIVGRNARSVLFGVYAYLETQGVRFVRPGPQGEVVPSNGSLAWPREPMVELAAHRHRGLCIEGATSLDHTLETVDWCAKRRMNTLFLQFFTSRYFYDLWYARPYNERYADHQVTDEEAFEYDQRVIASLKTRGMVCHRVGHGWTAATLGMPRSGWVRTDEALPPDRVRWAAELGGQRGLYDRMPINTELCYSHSPAFDALVENVVRYNAAHPEVDVPHVWLSDAANNKCECDACRQLSISDWYAKLINALSEALQRRAPGKRFVFLCYIELLWPPEKVKIDDRHGNIIMMYAPISRCYGHGLFDQGCDDGEAYPRPALNQYARPQSNAFFVRSLAKWRQVFHGDGFDFDYHLMWAVWRQLTDTRLARVLHLDLQHLKGGGLDGIVSCQSFRNFYPSGLAMSALADALWDPGQSWDEIKGRHLEAAFGEYASLADEYLAGVEPLLDTGDVHHRAMPLADADEAKLAACVEFLGAWQARLASRADEKRDAVWEHSLDLLAHHARFLSLLVDAYRARLEGGQAEADPAFDTVAEFLRDTEPEYHAVMDTMLALRNLEQAR